MDPTRSTLQNYREHREVRQNFGVGGGVFQLSVMRPPFFKRNPKMDFEFYYDYARRESSESDIPLKILVKNLQQIRIFSIFRVLLITHELNKIHIKSMV